MFETSGIYFDRRYRWRSGSEQITESRKIMNEIRMPKDILVKTIQEMFANNYLVIHQKMNKLIAELDTYQQIVHTNGKIEYQ
ncbi:MAG: hypothetical protein NZZ41_02895 [Candidatus Dojkabacteria bacterium]|nr:hypothetical protein [Candidatus Dojkabacteria bacterium]